MPLPRYEREREERATPKFRRAVLIFFAVMALIGMAVGVLWVIAGLL